jgi:TRAP-type mannitol/chloroaromatic compound transport system permease large subunit
VSSREKLRLLKNTVAPILLIILVLGIIFVGIATPVEAAGIGTFGALFVSALHRRLNWLNIQQAAIATLKATTMVMWIFFGATMFVGFFIVKGHSVADNADLPANHEKPGLGGVFGIPGVRPEDVPLWYGVIFMVNMQMAFLSPPFGYSLFYLKSVAPPQITMATIFRAAVNFMVLQWISVGLYILFPQSVLWLPSIVYAGH